MCVCVCVCVCVCACVHPCVCVCTLRVHVFKKERIRYTMQLHMSVRNCQSLAKAFRLVQ